MSALIGYLWYEFVYWVTFFGMTLLLSMRVIGRRNIPLTGPVLVIANHQSFIDPTMCGLSAPRHVFYLARKTLFKKAWFGWLLRSLNSVPVDQEGVGKDGLKTILHCLQQDQAVIVFPEGQRTPDGAMQELKPGILLLIKRVDCKIVPIGISGALTIWPRWQKLPKLAPLFLPYYGRSVALSIGPPLEAKRFAAMEREAALAALLQELQTQMDKAERLRRKQ